MVKGEQWTIIRVSRDFSRKMNMMKHYNGYPSLYKFTKDLADNNDFENFMMQMKQRKKNELFKI